METLILTTTPGLRRPADHVVEWAMPTDATLRDLHTAASLPDWTDDAEH